MNELRLFISSTFRDLQEEREHLVKKIFPEIRALCRQRGVTFTDIDLRWGITEEEAERDGILRICLEEIDRCRPYFIGILGERYGWVPAPEDVDRVGNDFPEIIGSIAGGTSITEMEIVHGVLANPAMAGHSFFYFRDRAATPRECFEVDEQSIARLRALKERIRQSRFPTREGFRSATELGEWLREDLLRVLEEEFPQSATPGPLARERSIHAAFAASRKRAYIPNARYRNEFSRWVASGEKPLMITGDSGLGKSSLTAYLVDEYRHEHPDSFIIEYYVGASPASGSTHALMQQIIAEIRERFAIDAPLPEKSEEIEQGFLNWLFRLQYMLERDGIESLIVIDALNQLRESRHGMSWLPRTIPSGVKLMVSTTPGDIAEQLLRRGWNCMEVSPLADERMRRDIVTKYLGEFRKSVSVDQLRRLAADAKAESPLYLRVISEELRLHGEYETIGHVIDRFSERSDLLDVFEEIIARTERDHGEPAVRTVLGLIAVSRSGLSESELLQLARMSRVDLSLLLFAFDYHLVQRDGLLGFFHDYLLRAVEKRYLSDSRQSMEWRRSIVKFFEQESSPDRSSPELLWQYRYLNDQDGMLRLLRRLPALVMLCNGEAEFEVLGIWKDLIGHGVDPVGTYEMAVSQYLNLTANPVGLFEALSVVGRLFESLHRLQEAIGIYRQWVSVAERYDDQATRADALWRLGAALFLHREYDLATEHLEDACRLAKEAGADKIVAGTLGELGNVFMAQHDYDSALKRLQEGRECAMAINDIGLVAGTTMNIAGIHLQRGEYDRAMDGLVEAFDLFSEVGHRKHMAAAQRIMGQVYCDHGDYDKALSSLAQSVRLCEEVVDTAGMCYSLLQTGSVHTARRRYEQAIACYQDVRRIAEEIRDQPLIANTAAHMGLVYRDTGEYDLAMECQRRFIDVWENLGDRRLVHIGIGNKGKLHFLRGEYSQALECYRRANDVHRAVEFPFGLTYWLDGAAEVLLQLALSSDAMPDYLPDYVENATPADWRPSTLRRAAELAREGVHLSMELRKSDTLFSNRVLLARAKHELRAVDDRPQEPPEPIGQLRSMLNETDDDFERSELHYWLWTMEKREDDRREGLRLYRSLVEATPKQEYRTRIAELEGASL